MNKNWILRICSVLLLVPVLGQAQTQKQEENTKMEWFEDAKLGVFIHWGIYAVDGISESWAFFNNYINHDNYMRQLDGFTASDYNAEEWVELIKKSGAKYSVITTRHHDGVSLWDSKAEKALTTVQHSAAKKDVLTPFVQALQKQGLKTGLYYSLPDWSHPYYDVNTRTRKRYEVKEDADRWGKYVDYYQTQLAELSELYHPDLIWFDGDWEHTDKEWKAAQTLDLLKGYNENIVINSRLNGHGDYETPEQGIPVVTPGAPYWELCYTMNDSWGYQPFDTNYKSPNMIVRTLVDVISMGGNLLIDIGPKEDGSLPEEQVKILEELGRWTQKHGEAVYGTRKGLPFENYKGKSTISKDGKSLFLYIEGQKEKDRIAGIHTPIQSARIIGDKNGKVAYKQDAEGNVFLELEDVDFDSSVTVVELTFDSNVQFEAPEKKEVDLKMVFDQENVKNAAYTLASELHLGNNLLDGKGLAIDGQAMDLPDYTENNAPLKNWISKHAEALYQTEKGLPDGHYAGLSALSSDRQTLYLFVEGKPSGPIAIKGLKNGISRIRIVGEGSMIHSQIFNKLYWSEVPGIVYIDVPESRLDSDLTVIAVLLDKSIELFRDRIGAVESNE